jgi:FlgN protein
LSGVLEHADTVLSGDVIAHLDAQLVAARRLLSIVLDQGAAIRARDVQNVVALTGLLQAELQRRQILDHERARLLERAGERLGVTAHAVTLTQLERVMPSTAAEPARERSAELTGLLEEVKREHYVNRALMSQELAFLDHLLRLADGGGDVTYDAAGDRPAISAGRVRAQHRVLDLEV